MIYWKELDRQVEKYANKNGFMYVIDEEPFSKIQQINLLLTISIMKKLYNLKIKSSTNYKYEWNKFVFKVHPHFCKRARLIENSDFSSKIENIKRTW